MAATDLVSGPLFFVQQLHEHSRTVHEGVKLIEPLVDALLAQDRAKMQTLHQQLSQIANEADQIKLALYDQVKDVHFGSPGSYAFSRYVSSQNRMVGSAQDFADLLLSRQTTIPVESRAAFQALLTQVVSVSGRMINLAKEFSSPAEADSTDPHGQDVLTAITGIIEGNRRTRQLEMEFARHVYRQARQLNAATVLALDRYSMALGKITDAAECAANHLRLMIP